MLRTPDILTCLSFLVAFTSIATGCLKYVPPAGSQRRQCTPCSSRDLKIATRFNPMGRIFWGSSGSTDSSGTTCCTTTTTAAPATGCKCGVKNNGIRIVGGQETAINEYPWMAGLMSSRAGTSFYCGASLVASQFVVTAAHCLEGTQPSQVFVVLGEHDTASTTETTLRKVFGVSKIILNPTYNSFTSVGDIAVLKLDETVDLNVYTPLCLPAMTDTWAAGREAWVYGWGNIAEGGSINQPSTLQEVAVPFLSRDTCSANYAPWGVTIFSDMVCAGETGKDSCQGDSGGPLSTVTGDQHVLAGAVSFGIGCARENLPGVYSNVATYRMWLDETFSTEGGATFCSGVGSRY